MHTGCEAWGWSMGFCWWSVEWLIRSCVLSWSISFCTRVTYRTVSNADRFGGKFTCGGNCVSMNCRALQCVAVRCSVLQCVAVCCNVKQWNIRNLSWNIAAWRNTSEHHHKKFLTEGRSVIIFRSIMKKQLFGDCECVHWCSVCTHTVCVCTARNILECYGSFSPMILPIRSILRMGSIMGEKIE